MSLLRHVTAALLSLAPVISHAGAPALPATELYSHVVHDCADIDIATWHHPTQAVLKSASIQLKKLQLCNGSKYPVFTVVPKFDPRGDTASTYHPLYARLAQANGWWPYALVDNTDKVIITVYVTKNPNGVDIHYEEFQ